MRELFIAAFILFAAVEIFIVVKLSGRHKKLGLRSTVSSFGLYCALVLLKYIFSINIPYYILLLTLVAVFVDTFFGYFREYYWKFTRFDRYAHGYSIFSYALLFYYLIISFVDSGGSRVFRALFIVFLGISSGAFFEILEFLSDRKQETRMQKGLKDTNFDILFDCMGSILSGLFAYFVFL